MAWSASRARWSSSTLRSTLLAESLSARTELRLTSSFLIRSSRHSQHGVNVKVWNPVVARVACGDVDGILWIIAS